MLEIGIQKIIPSRPETSNVPLEHAKHTLLLVPQHHSQPPTGGYVHPVLAPGPLAPGFPRLLGPLYVQELIARVDHHSAGGPGLTDGQEQGDTKGRQIRWKRALHHHQSNPQLHLHKSVHHNGQKEVDQQEKHHNSIYYLVDHLVDLVVGVHVSQGVEGPLPDKHLKLGPGGHRPGAPKPLHSMPQRAACRIRQPHVDDEKDQGKMEYIIQCQFDGVDQGGYTGVDGQIREHSGGEAQGDPELHQFEPFKDRKGVENTSPMVGAARALCIQSLRCDPCYPERSRRRPPQRDLTQRHHKQHHRPHQLQ
mmetsp:Transcript_23172/g.52382  ORF Transcript_23172/g.52382 Transcript_23172/m.52382 type:complete len:307 (-) Transcript_23172:1429-2349(-)